MKQNTPGKAALPEEFKSIIYWIVVAVFLVLMLWAPLQHGLFNGQAYLYERPLFSFSIWCGLLLLLLSLYLFFNWELRGPAGKLSLFIWCWPAVYLLAAIHPATSSGAWKAVVIAAGSVVFFLIGLYFFRNEKASRLFYVSLMLSGALIVVYGFMNWFGDATLFGMFRYADNSANARIFAGAVPQSTSRLQNVFQYANAYGAFLVVLILFFLHQIASARKLPAAICAAVVLVPAVVSLLLTQSRGALVILPVVLLLLLPLLGLWKQLLWLGSMAIATLCSLAVLGRVDAIGAQTRTDFRPWLAFRGWMWIVLASAVFAAAVYLIRKHLETPLGKKLAEFEASRRWKYAVYFSPVIIVIGAAGVLYALVLGTALIRNLLPAAIYNRLQAIDLTQFSFLERVYFIRDAFAMFADKPVLGHGGGAWGSLYPRYQSYPYASAETHSYLMKIMVETGLAGAAVLLLLIGYIYYGFLRHYRRDHQGERSRLLSLIGATALLILSLIDFTLSYVYFEVLFFLFLGAMAAALPDSAKPGVVKEPGEYWKYGYAALAFLVALAVLVPVTRQLQGDTLFRYAVQQNLARASDGEVIETLDAAMAIRGQQPDYATMKLELLSKGNYPPDEAKRLALLDEAASALARSEPNNRKLLEFRIYSASASGNHKQAFEWMESGLRLFPWDAGLLENAIRIGFALGEQARVRDKDSAEAADYRSRVLRLYRDKQAALAANSDRQQSIRDIVRNVTISREGKLPLSIMLYYDGDYREAIDLLQSALDPALDTPLDREMARWLIVAWIRTESPQAEPLYELLITKDPQEADKVSQILDDS